jgi:hypothetical protein
VGYIDPAPLANLFRERFEAGYNFQRPTRAEFFYAQTRPAGPGLPMPESRVDYQELYSYLEVILGERMSTFVEVPVRFLSPQVNSTASGLGDMNFGLKYLLQAEEDRIATFQFRTYVPTGDANLGLGNNHASLEPGLLLWQRLSDQCGLEGELRFWAPLGGTGFAGDIVRYGVGAYYRLYENDRLAFTPVAEFVGWTVLNGKESFVQASGMPAIVQASGDTIVNAKVGLRVSIAGLGDFYAGYGHPITGDRWYENVFRVEFRVRF